MCEIAKTRRFWKKEQRSTEKRRRDNIKGYMKKYQLTEDMTQYRKYWTTKIMVGPAQGDGQETEKRKVKKHIKKVHLDRLRLNYLVTTMQERHSILLVGLHCNYDYLDCTG